MLPASGATTSSQQAGSIRGSVSDKDFDVALGAAEVAIVETGQKVVTSDQGNYSFGEVAPGRYTLVFSKSGYARQVKADVVVTSGQLTDVDAFLSGEFTEMEEFVVQDMLQFGAGSEGALLRMRFEAPALMDSIGSDLMSRAGASDAAGALRLVSGASVQNGKYAVIRGLPDRYISSQMNGVRLPSADESKRAIELDQFPATVLESIQVSKTFTPDQQGDASGGAVNVMLKGIPDEGILQFKGKYIYNSQASGRGDFLTYEGGGMNFWGRDDGTRSIQFDRIGQSWEGAAGTSTGNSPADNSWSLAAGGTHLIGADVKVGGFASFFYERNSSFYDNGRDDSYWVVTPGAGMVPQTFQGTPQQGDFKTALFDVTQGVQSLRWGGLGTLGIEDGKQKVDFTYLFTHVAQDTATLAIDTRGKDYFFPGYDVNNPNGIGNSVGDIHAAPYVRQETLNYSERNTMTLELNGRHELPIDGFGSKDTIEFKKPELDWFVARSTANLNEPDKREFSAIWLPPGYNPGFPPFIAPFITPPTWYPYKPAASFTLGNFQRIFERIDEQSSQYGLNLKIPFEQWSEREGYLKTGLYQDHVDRTFTQDSFSNFSDNSSFVGDFNQPWSGVFPFEDHPITQSLIDVDYDGTQKVSAAYGMMDLPLTSSLSVIGGARLERAEIDIVNHPGPDATWFPPGATAPVILHPGDADVSFRQKDVLPSIGLVATPVKEITFRATYSETVARQTFKELTPIMQQEFVGGPIFIGNPDLKMSSLKNYDLRLDYTPYEDSLLSASWFRKDIKDPIEYVQQLVDFVYTTAENYPEGRLDGWEFEARQGLGRLWDPLEGIALGANATLINSNVTLPASEAAAFDSPAIQAPMKSRDMTNAPDHIYNFFVTYDNLDAGTQVALFYTLQGDTLIEGAGVSSGNFVPSVYARQFGTLNFSVSQTLGKGVKLDFQAKNLTNPKIEEVYRSRYIGGDVTKSSYTKGIEFSIALTVTF